MHRAAAQAVGIPLRYDLWPVQAEGLPDAVRAVRGSPWLGANVTLPHKPAILALVDSVTPPARRIGAINTLYKREGLLHGDNTDAPAFLECLRRQLGFQAIHEQVVVLGAGGAARAAIVALLDAGVRSVAIWNRTADRTPALRAELTTVGVPTGAVRLIATNVLDRQLAAATLLVNATSVGLDGHSLPLAPAALAGASDLRIFDMVYGLDGTPLVRHARSLGITAVDGLWMLVRQAAAAFALWTGRQPPEDAMHAAAMADLEERGAARQQGTMA
jgi:shikimate dehydrogenase